MTLQLKSRKQLIKRTLWMNHQFDKKPLDKKKDSFDQLNLRNNREALERSLEKARRYALARTHEEKSEASRRAIQHRDRVELESTLQRARASSLCRTHKEKSEASKRAIQRRDRQELALTLKKARAASQARSHEQKSAAARKAAQHRYNPKGVEKTAKSTRKSVLGTQK